MTDGKTYVESIMAERTTKWQHGLEARAIESWTKQANYYDAKIMMQRL